MRRAGFLTKVIMAILIVVFSATLVYNVYSYRVEQRENTQSLKTDSDQVKQEEKIEHEEEEKRIAEEKAIAERPIPISCRGESWALDDSDKEDGWPAKLGKIIETNEINATVSDYTWDMSGTLSQMRLAGISEETVDAYIEKHEEDGLRGNEYETTVRSDLEDYLVERDDYEAIPVICIGYNGGFGNSSDELIEQQGEILNTYTLQEAGKIKDSKTGVEEVVTYNDGDMGISGKYLIVGHLPSGWRDLDNYENRMKDAWGDHFVSLNDIDEDVLSESFREGVAEAVYDKLVELRYLEK